MQKVIVNATEYVKQLFQREFSGHDFYHTMRVYNLATRIAKCEHANIEIVQLVALLHDVDDFKLSPQTHATKANARNFLLQNNVDQAVVEQICQMIEEISFVGTDTVVPQTLEGRCVQDADRLDAIGAIGIARAFAFGGNHNRLMYDPNDAPKLNMTKEQYRSSKSNTINHFYEKLFHLAELMNTPTAKAIAHERHCYMQQFVEQFLAEWNGEK